MKPGLRGVTLSFFEVTAAYAAVDIAILSYPRGKTVSRSLELLHAKLSERKRLNDAELERRVARLNRRVP